MKEVRELWRVYGLLFEDKEQAGKVADFKESAKKVYGVIDTNEKVLNNVSELDYRFHTMREHAEDDVRDENQ